AVVTIQHDEAEVVSKVERAIARLPREGHHLVKDLGDALPPGIRRLVPTVVVVVAIPHLMLPDRCYNGDHLSLTADETLAHNVEPGLPPAPRLAGTKILVQVAEPCVSISQIAADHNEVGLLGSRCGSKLIKGFAAPGVSTDDKADGPLK